MQSKKQYAKGISQHATEDNTDSPEGGFKSTQFTANSEPY
jgi:hypothetical protein